MTGVNITVADSTGQVVFQTICAPSQTDNLDPGTYFQCLANWNTGIPYEGVPLSAGTYTLYVSVPGIPDNKVTATEADIQIVGQP